MVVFLFWVPSAAWAGAEAAMAVAAPPTIMPRRDTENSLRSANVTAPFDLSRPSSTMRVPASGYARSKGGTVAAARMKRLSWLLVTAKNTKGKISWDKFPTGTDSARRQASDLLASRIAGLGIASAGD